MDDEFPRVPSKKEASDLRLRTKYLSVRDRQECKRILEELSKERILNPDQKQYSIVTSAPVNSVMLEIIKQHLPFDLQLSKVEHGRDDESLFVLESTPPLSPL